MALGATIHSFAITLNDADRGVYAALDLRVARHPSETAEFLLARVLAYALEYREGLEFSKGGLSDTDEPALAVRDLTGALQAWIEVGAPDAARLHRAAKAAPRVVVYCHKDVPALLERLAGASIHRAAEIEVRGLDRALLAALAARLQRRTGFDLSVSEGHLYLTLPDATLDGVVSHHRIGEAAKGRVAPIVSRDD
ncbi:MAG: YaeQ family protein [Steroidobacteraceae bacterium]|jgi:uncharacterized protein YaeQ|nr:YaeQ family protein [Steroidobacteraceae bacterium]